MSSSLSSSVVVTSSAAERVTPLLASGVGSPLQYVRRVASQANDGLGYPGGLSAQLALHYAPSAVALLINVAAQAPGDVNASSSSAPALSSSSLGTSSSPSGDKRSLKTRVTGFLGASKMSRSYVDDGSDVGGSSGSIISSSNVSNNNSNNSVNMNNNNSSNSINGNNVGMGPIDDVGDDDDDGGDAAEDGDDSNGWRNFIESDEATTLGPVKTTTLFGVVRSIDAPLKPPSLARFEGCAPGRIVVLAVGARQSRRRQHAATTMLWTTTAVGVAQWSFATRSLLRVVVTGLAPQLAAHCLVGGDGCMRDADVDADAAGDDDDGNNTNNKNNLDDDDEIKLLVGGVVSEARVLSAIDRRGVVCGVVEGASGVSAPVVAMLGVNRLLLVAHANGTVSSWQ